MKKLIAALLFAAVGAYAQAQSCPKSGCDTGGSSGSVAVGDITGLGAGVAAWLATASSANLATAVSDETGSGLLVFASNPNFTLLRVNNGATGAGCIGLLEDSDNGANTATFCGPASTGDVTLTLPAATDTLVGLATTDTLSNKTLTLPKVGNGSTSAGYIEFREDTDNGTNYVRVLGVDSITSDRTLQLPSIAGDKTLATTSTNVWEDGTKQTFNPDATNAGINVGSQAGNPSAVAVGDIWYNSTHRRGYYANYNGATGHLGPSGGPDMVVIYDEMACGDAGGTSQSYGSCLGTLGVQTGGTLSAGGSETTGGTDDYDRIGIAVMNANALNDVANIGSQSLVAGRLIDRFRIQFAVNFDLLADAGDEFYWLGGATDCTTASDATNGWECNDGVYVYANMQDDNSVPNWQMVVGNGSLTQADCGIAVAADTWYDWDIWYESGTGVHFVLNGTECSNSPINTTLPTGAGDMFAPYRFKLEDITATTPTSFDVYVDYVKVTIPVTRP